MQIAQKYIYHVLSTSGVNRYARPPIPPNTIPLRRCNNKVWVALPPPLPSLLPFPYTYPLLPIPLLAFPYPLPLPSYPPTIFLLSLPPPSHSPAIFPLPPYLLLPTPLLPVPSPSYPPPYPLPPPPSPTLSRPLPPRPRTTKSLLILSNFKSFTNSFLPVGSLAPIDRIK